MKNMRQYILTLVLLLMMAPAFAQTSKIDQQKKVIADLERSIALEEKQLSQLKKIRRQWRSKCVRLPSKSRSEMP